MRKRVWTEESIKAGFSRFYEEYGRLPRSQEVDSLTYLPSSRLIQKKFDGLEKLRLKLGFTDTHFGKGKYRSIIADSVNVRGTNFERALENILYKKFGEVFVHSEKMLSKSKVRVDFYIYSPDGNFAVDVFYSENLRTLQSNVNIKSKKYLNYDVELYLVSANTNISQENLEQYTRTKKNPLPSTVHLLSWATFVEKIESIGVYKNPIAAQPLI